MVRDRLAIERLLDGHAAGTRWRTHLTTVERFALNDCPELHTSLGGPTPLRPKHVVVVDHYGDIREMIAELLRGEGFVVRLPAS